MPSPQKRYGKGLTDWFAYQFQVKQFKTPVGITVLLLLAIALGFTAAKGWLLINFGLIALLVGSIASVICIINPYWGYYLVILLSFFAFYPERMVGFPMPVSTVTEILILLTFMGWQLQRKKITTARVTEKTSFVKSPAAIAYILYTAFVLIQAFNPEMDSKTGWLFFIRKYTGITLMFVMTYLLIDDYQKLKYFFRFWITLGFIAALYGCIQQFFGLMPFEINWLMKDPLLVKLYFQGGQYRKFSFLADPVEFGILMAALSLMIYILALNGNFPKKQRIQLYIVATVCLMGMAFSGTRTTYLMIPAGVGLYGLMTINNKRTLIVLFSFLMIAAFIIFGPVYTPTFYRIKTAFQGTKDASAQVRDVNRHYIQPYIYEHPLGGGLMTSGQEGVRFNPGHPLAGFPPDSGLLKLAIETGWVGLLVIMLHYLMLLYQGISYYFKARRPRVRVMLLSLTVPIFTIILAQYAQVSIGQTPSVYFFFGAIAIMPRLMDIDKSKNENLI